MGHYEHPRLVATVERVDATESPSRSLPATFSDRDGPHSSSLARVRSDGRDSFASNRFDPDDNLTDNSHRRVIGGIAYWLAWNRARLGLVATNEQITYDEIDGRADENRILLQTHVEF